MTTLLPFLSMILAEESILYPFSSIITVPSLFTEVNVAFFLVVLPAAITSPFIKNNIIINPIMYPTICFLSSVLCLLFFISTLPRSFLHSGILIIFGIENFYPLTLLPVFQSLSPFLTSPRLHSLLQNQLKNL